MKNYFKFRFMLLAMAALGIVSCADKLVTDDVSQPQGDVNDGFVAFEISSVDNLTRAADYRDDADKGYDEGTANEYAITSDRGANVVFFFNADGSYQDKSVLQVMGQEDDQDHNGAYNDENNANASGNGNKEKVYSARIRRSINNQPLYAVLILNGDPTQLEGLVSGFTTPATTDLANFMKSVDKVGLGSYGSYFTMSNTVYAEEDGQNKLLQGPKKIEPNQIKPTWQEAQENKIVVHVERVLAKFEVSFKNNDQSILTNKQIIYTDDEQQLPARVQITEDGVTKLTDGKKEWGVRITGWGINGTETATHWMKNLNDGTSYGSTSFPNVVLPTGMFGLWDFKYGTDKGWNDASRVRSYWAVDPHYNTADGTSANNYPQQYRNSTDPDNPVIAGHGTDFDVNSDNKIYDFATDNVLNYISYEQIIEDDADYKYAPENTFGAYEANFFTTIEDDAKFQFQGNAYKRTSTHILVAAELLMGDEETGDNYTGELSDKYCYGGVYWTEKEAGENNLDLIKYMVEVLLDYVQTPLYTSTGENPVQFDVEGDTEDWFTLAKATTKGGDGRLMLALTGNKKLYCKTEDGSFEEYNLSSDIYKVGTVKHYHKGKMYYAIPIEHMVAYSRSANANEAEKWNIGSYGVVRNHWYRVNISAIAKPGIPVDDPDQPIIPNDEPDEPGYAAFEIVIVPWHVIDQGVTL